MKSVTIAFVKAAAAGEIEVESGNEWEVKGKLTRSEQSPYCPPSMAVEARMRTDLLLWDVLGHWKKPNRMNKFLIGLKCCEVVPDGLAAASGRPHGQLWTEHYAECVPSILVDFLVRQSRLDVASELLVQDLTESAERFPAQEDLVEEVLTSHPRKERAIPQGILCLEQSGAHLHRFATIPHRQTSRHMQLHHMLLMHVVQ